MTCVMFLLVMLVWFVLGAATMVVVAALGRAGRLQDERRAAATSLTTRTTDRRPAVARAA
jgi:hypothetical protein